MGQEIRNAADELVKSSGLLRQDLELDIDPGEISYPFKTIPVSYTPMEDASFSGLQATYAHYVRLADGSYVGLRDWRPGGSVRVNPGVPRHAFSSSFGVMELVPPPSDAMNGQKFYINATLTLVRPISWVPAMLAETSYETILDGATGRMMSHPKRPYSDVKMAEYYLRRFRDGIRTAANDVKVRWSNAESTFQYNPDWSSRARIGRR
jgi:hypothetical protein